MMSGAAGAPTITIDTAATTPNADQPLFELPSAVLEEDVVVLQNLLTALHSLERLCTRYKVELLVTGGYMLRALLPASEFFELTLDDQLFLHGVSPARIQSIAVGRTANGGPVELFIRVLDARQRVMVASTTTCYHFSSTRKRVRCY